MRVYANKAHYQADQRYHLNDITKALWSDRSDAERERVYGAWVRSFACADQITEADVVLLPMKWNYYVERGLTALAQQEFETARRHGKRIVVFSGGDHPANLAHPNVVLFESAGCRSAGGLAGHQGLPFFLKDTLALYCQGQVQERPWTAVPKVGFCGQAGGSPLQTVYRAARNRLQNAQYRAGLRRWQPPPFETSRFRRNVLRRFEGRQGIKTNYLLRSKYHAGDDRDKSDFSPQKMDFVRNILDSDYTICMRGGGNFSVRFYETLALGRIPVFIDTDCLLPWHDTLPYRELFPWISAADLPRAAEILLDFHRSLSDDDFRCLQRRCRRLWETHLSANGFYQTFSRQKWESSCSIA